jgi:hypothetical protein
MEYKPVLLSNQALYEKILEAQMVVSDRVIEGMYKDSVEEKWLFYISQELFLALNLAQDILDRDKAKLIKRLLEETGEL